MSRTDIGLAILRITLGGVFLAHGIQKVVVWGIAGGVPFFRDVGIPLPEVAAPLVASVETLGGAALVLGLLTRPAAVALAVVMLVAAVTVHLPHGFFLPGGMEFVLTLAAASTCIAIAGPGAFAVESRSPAGKRTS